MNFKTRRLKITREHLVVHSNEGPDSLVISTAVPPSGDVSVAVRPYGACCHVRAAHALCVAMSRTSDPAVMTGC